MSSSYYDKLETIIQSDVHNCFIYQTISILVEHKNQTILDISKYEKIEESLLIDPLTESHPDPLLIYISSLDRLSLLCRTLSYKLDMKGQIAVAATLSGHGLQNECDNVIKMIKKKPNISYFEIVSKNSADRNDLALERLIEAGEIVRVGAMNNPYKEDHSYWKIIR